MTSNGVVTAEAMLFCQGMSYICACVCDAFGGEGNPFSGKSMWFSRGGPMVIKSYAEVGGVVETRFV